MGVATAAGTATVPALLLLADGRFPVGGHAHSAGIEAAIDDGRVRDHDDVVAFVEGRVRTAGLVDAALAAATVVRLDVPGDVDVAVPAVLAALDAEAGARIPVAALREASRRLGRQLTRVASGCWPHAVLADVATVHPDGPHQSVALGAVGVAAGLDPAAVAALALHHAVTTPIQASIRILGLDPFALAALSARLGTVVADLTAVAVAAATGPLADLPCVSGPVVDIAAVAHAGRDSRLFVT